MQLYLFMEYGKVGLSGYSAKIISRLDHGFYSFLMILSGKYNDSPVSKIIFTLFFLSNIHFLFYSHLL